MSLHYHDRNLKNLEKLADHTKIAAMKWYNYLIENNIDVLIYETIRTEAQQRENVRKGASQTMKSFHLVGQALDFVPVASGGRTDWNGYKQPKIQQAIAEAKRLGFEWGGDWKDFIDRPHLQYNHSGYGSDTFGKYTEKVTVANSAPKEENKMAELNESQEKVRQEAIKLGITDGKDPFREVNQYYVWSAMIPLARRIEELEKK